MVIYEDGCVGCPPELGCLGSSCPNRRYPRYFCDICGEECDTVYVSKSGEILGCDNCIDSKMPEEVM